MDLLDSFFQEIFEDIGQQPKKIKPAGAAKAIIAPHQVYQSTDGNWQARNRDNEHASFGNDYESFKQAMKWMEGGKGSANAKEAAPQAIDVGQLDNAGVKKQEEAPKAHPIAVPHDEQNFQEPASKMDQHLKNKKGRFLNKDNDIVGPPKHIKSKELKNVNAAETPAFKDGLGINYAQFKVQNENYFYSVKQFECPEFVKELANKGVFPQKYVSLIERVINTRETKATIKWKHFTDQPVGKGTVSSGIGELMTMMSCAMSDEDAEKFYKSVSAHLKDNVPAESREHMGADPVNRKLLVGNTTVFSSWRNRNTIMKRLRHDFGDKFSVENTCWDVDKEVEALGLRSAEDTGKSSDIFLKMKLDDGTTHLDEVSLKATLDANMLNSSVSKMRKWDKDIPESLNEFRFSHEQRKRLVEMGSLYADKITALLATGHKATDGLQKFMDIAEVNTFGEAIERKQNANTSRAIIEGLKLVALSGDKECTQFLAEQIKRSKQFSNHVILELAKNKNLVNGLIEEVRNNFPLREIATGEESMALERYSLDNTTLKKIFGTDNYDTIKDRMYAFPAPKPYIGYRAGPEGSEVIPIATIRVREGGMGWRGLFKFDMRFDPKFIAKIKNADLETYGKTVINLDDIS